MRTPLKGLLALTMWWTCSTEAFSQATHYEDIFWAMQAAPAPFDPSPQSRGIGELLFTQPFLSASEAVLTDGMSMPIPAASIFSRAPGNAVFEPGATLSQVRTPDETINMYCDRPVTLRERGSRKMRLCLSDHNRDGRFESVYWGVVSPPADPFVAMTLFLSDRSSASENYGAQEGTERLLSAGVVVTRSALNAYRLQFAVDDPAAPVVLRDQFIRSWDRRVEGEGPFSGAVYFRSSDIPLTLRIAGAEVEIFSIVGDVVTYRVVSNFSSDTDVGIGYNDSLPH